MVAIISFKQASHDNGAKEVVTWALTTELQMACCPVASLQMALGGAPHSSPLTTDCCCTNAPPPSVHQNTKHSVVEDSCKYGFLT